MTREVWLSVCYTGDFIIFDGVLSWIFDGGIDKAKVIPIVVPNKITYLELYDKLLDKLEIDSSVYEIVLRCRQPMKNSNDPLYAIPHSIFDDDSVDWLLSYCDKTRLCVTLKLKTENAGVVRNDIVNDNNCLAIDDGVHRSPETDNLNQFNGADEGEELGLDDEHGFGVRVDDNEPIKVLKRDANFLRVKLAVGCLPEKILTAMQLVQDDVDSEEEALNKCRDAISCVQELKKDAANASAQGNLQGSDLVDNIHKQEDTIQQCISELERSEDIRDALVSQLREALLDQESKLEQIKSELLVARAQIQRAPDTQHHLIPSSVPSSPQPVNPNTFPFNINSTEKGSKKIAAAAVATKLAASPSSAQMFTSILSSLVTGEAASKRPKLEPTEGGPQPNQAYYSSTYQMFTNVPSQSVSQVSQLQTPYLAPQANSNQMVVQPNGNVMGMAYGYGGGMGPPPQQVQQPTSGDDMEREQGHGLEEGPRPLLVYRRRGRV